MDLLSKGPKITIGSLGPFALGRDLGLRKYTVPLKKLDTHIYVVGRSGKGKSKFLEGLIWQLVTLGQGVGLIDPHGDLANNLLKLLAFHPLPSTGRPWLADPKNAARVIYCEPGRGDYFIPMNMLAGSDRPYTIATNVIEAFQRTWSESLAAAPQFKNVALHALLLLIEHRLSVVELPWLLMDRDFRERLVEQSQNEEVVAFFRQRFDKWGNEQALRIESLLNKVTALTLNDSLKVMLGDDENRLNMRQIMDEGKILIVNLGTCDHETRDLLGSMLTVQLEQAALTRVEMEEHQRKPWFCVLDEFQRFVANEGSAQVLAQMLSEVRKMGLRLCLAHQGWHQLGNTRLEGALDQAQIKVVFGSGTKTARVVAEELFVADPEKIKHQVADSQAQERTHPYYENLMEQKEMFVQSIRRQARREVVVLPPESDRVISLRTLTVPAPDIKREGLEQLKVPLLQTYGKSVNLATESTATRLSRKQQPNHQVAAGGLVAGV
ncbi:MAG TPA: type IV secretion system DNA-binding domain-containing protein [Dehalococcoidia bacterium]|nr:type IV secretion system DNA-binding domain-containing protein [Dehalococcoidia bacterium]